jgi:uncharacterized YigZ family protein
MLLQYLTIHQPAQHEIVEKKSRFIAYIQPLQHEQAVNPWLALIKKQHSFAQHHCYAYVIGQQDESQKFSDDGEPNGTAGKPILEIIKHHKLKNIGVVVVRYFGGVKLGAGGLARAYADATIEAIAIAEKINMVAHRNISVEVDYHWYGKLENGLTSKQILTDPAVFSDKIWIECYPLEQEAESVVRWITDFTQGQSQIWVKEMTYRKHPL